MPNAKRDQNRIPAIQGISSVDGVSLVDIHVNPSTNAILVDSESITSTLDTRYLPLSGGTMTGNLSMNGGNIVMGGTETVDGVDISTFKASYDSHVANANAHHNALTIGTNTASALSLSGAGGQVLNIADVFAQNSGDIFTGSISINSTIGLDDSFSGVVTKDGSRFLHGYGSLNVFVGANSGNGTLTGGTNTGVGYNTLTALTTGGSNTAIGSGVLEGLTSGQNNTAVGRFALSSLTDGSNSAAFGFRALESVTTGTQNSAFGYTAAQNVTTGGTNTVMGYAAMTGVTTEGGNSVFGRASFANGTGSNNVVIGHLAGFKVYGDQNVIIGYGAGTLNDNTISNKLIIHNTFSTSNYLIYGDFSSRWLEIKGTLETVGYGINVQNSSGTNLFQVKPSGVLNFTTQTPTSAAGDFWFDGDALNFQPTSDVRTLDLTDGIITSSTTVTNTTTETTVYTEAVSADEFHAGQSIHLRVLGRYSTANATDTVTLRLKIGGTTIKTFNTTAKNVTNTPLDVEFIFTIRTDGSTGTVWTYAKAELDDIATGSADTSTTTIDTTIAEDITISAQWSSANVSNSLSIDQGFTHFYN